MGEVGTQTVYYGFDFLELGNGGGTRIFYKRRRLRDRRQILGVPGLSVAGDGYISAERILTVIFCWMVWGPWVGVGEPGS